jgi:transposase
MWQVVFGVQASLEVKLHAVFLVQFHGLSFATVGYLFGKSASSIHRWVCKFREIGDVTRKKQAVPAATRKLEKFHLLWLTNYVLNVDPLTYLSELQKAFSDTFNFDISVSSLSRALASLGLSYKVIERRAMQIRDVDISRFTREVNYLLPHHEQLLFLDEMSLDNRSLLRNKGWYFKNQKLVYCGTFVRSKRLSILAFLGCSGVVEVFREAGTFSRSKFLSCCQELLMSGKICKYPGPRSVWIMDGASIHCSKEMIGYFWSVGIVILFLPAYAPFYNPIEILFGMVKRWCKTLHVEKGKEASIVFEALTHYGQFDFSPIFQHCGYSKVGDFNPHINYVMVENLAGFEN